MSDRLAIESRHWLAEDERQQHALRWSVKFFCFFDASALPDYHAPARGQRRCPTAQSCGQPPDGGSVVAHRLPASFAFGLTRRCAACPNQIKEQEPPTLIRRTDSACREAASRAFSTRSDRRFHRSVFQSANTGKGCVSI